MKKSILGFAAVSVVGMACGAANAAVLYDSKGFETSAGFTTGALQGQSATDAPVWQVATTSAGAPNASAATVETSLVYSGTQAVQFTRTLANQDTYYAPVFNVAPSARYMDTSWRMYMASGATQDAFFGVYAFNYPDSLAYGGIDGTTGQIEYSQGGTAALLSSGKFVALNSWNSFTLQLDYTSQVATLYVNGSPIASSGFIGSSETGFTDADICSFSTNAAQTATGTAYYDDYSLFSSTTAVPEPASAAAIAGISLALSARRRRQ